MIGIDSLLQAVLLVTDNSAAVAAAFLRRDEKNSNTRLCFDFLSCNVLLCKTIFFSCRYVASNLGMLRRNQRNCTDKDESPGRHTSTCAWRQHVNIPFQWNSSDRKCFVSTWRRYSEKDEVWIQTCRTDRNLGHWAIAVSLWQTSNLSCSRVIKHVCR